jgi:MFS family permease
MLPLGLFRSRPLSAASALTVVTYFALYGVLFFWTLYLQRVLGDSPVTSGVQLLPLTAGFVVMSPLAGWIGPRFGTRVSLLAGLLGIAAGSVVLTRVQIADGYGGVWPAFLLLGASLSLAAIAGVQTMMSNAPLRFAGVAGAVMTTACQLGGVLGIAVLGSVLGSHTAAAQLAPHGALTPQLAAAASARAFLAGLHAAMWVAAGVALAGSVLAPLARRGESEVGPVHLV